MVELSEMDVVTPPVRISFPALFEPKPVTKGSDEKKYQAVLLIPPEVDLKPFLRAVKAAMISKWEKVIKLPARNNPIKSCDEKEDLEGYEPGWHYISVRSNYRPRVVDQNLNEILDPEVIYPGCWCRFHLKAYPWEHPQGGKGVSFSLNSVQFVKNGPRLDGRLKPEDVFEPLEIDDQDDELADLFN